MFDAKGKIKKPYALEILVYWQYNEVDPRVEALALDLSYDFEHVKRAHEKENLRRAYPHSKTA